MFSGKMCTSSATSEPSRWPTVVVPMNLPLAISSTLAFVIPMTTKVSASFTFTLSPLRAFTVRIWPSTDSTVPRVLTGGLAGAWATAAAETAASSIAAMVRIMGVSFSLTEQLTRQCGSLFQALDRGLHAFLPQDRAGVRRSEESDQRPGRRRFFCRGVDAARKDRDMLDVGRQRAQIVDAPDGQQLAHLLEADLGFAPRNQLAGLNAGGRLNQPRLQLVGDPHALEQAQQIDAARAARNDDRFRPEQRALQRFAGADRARSTRLP